MFFLLAGVFTLGVFLGMLIICLLIVASEGKATEISPLIKQ